MRARYALDLEVRRGVENWRISELLTGPSTPVDSKTSDSSRLEQLLTGLLTPVEERRMR